MLSPAFFFYLTGRVVTVLGFPAKFGYDAWVQESAGLLWSTFWWFRGRFPSRNQAAASIATSRFWAANKPKTAREAGFGYLESSSVAREGARNIDRERKRWSRGNYNGWWDPNSGNQSNGINRIRGNSSIILFPLLLLAFFFFEENGAFVIFLFVYFFCCVYCLCSPSSSSSSFQKRKVQIPLNIPNFNDCEFVLIFFFHISSE